MKGVKIAIALFIIGFVVGKLYIAFESDNPMQHEPQPQQVRPWLPSEGHCKQARYIMANTRYYTSSDLRMAKQIVERCEELDNSK